METAGMKRPRLKDQSDYSGSARRVPTTVLILETGLRFNDSRAASSAT
jgi:hypothetical protein